MQINKTILKYVGLAVLGLIVLYALIWILTPKSVMPQEFRAKLDSLTAVNQALLTGQKRLDSSIQIYEASIAKMDSQIVHTKQKETIIKEIYHEKIERINAFDPHEIDSFFKARYSY